MSDKRYAMKINEAEAKRLLESMGYELAPSPSSGVEAPASGPFLEQQWNEIRGTMEDNLLNLEQKKTFVMSILRGVLANPPAPASGPVPVLDPEWRQQDFKDLNALHPYPDPARDALVRLFMWEESLVAEIKRLPSGKGR